MGNFNNAAHHFEHLRSCDCSDAFNHRCRGSQPDGPERTPERPATIRLADLESSYTAAVNMGGAHAGVGW